MPYNSNTLFQKMPDKVSFFYAQISKKWLELSLKKFSSYIFKNNGESETVLYLTNGRKRGSLSTVVGDEKLTSRENLIGFLFLYVQSDENTLPKVNKVSKTEAQTFDVFDKLIGPLQFCI